jgi:hypothetical protein
MRWAVTDRSATQYSQCILLFRGLHTLMISPRHQELPLSEDLCVAGISKVAPGQTEPPEHRTRSHWDALDTFDLWFTFQSGRSIELSADTVELIGVAREVNPPQNHE